MTIPDSFTCPTCHMTSWNPNDIKEGYCGNCHDYTRDTTLPKFGTVNGSKHTVVSYVGMGYFILQVKGGPKYRVHRSEIKFTNA